MTTVSTTKRKGQLRKAMQKDAPWGASIKFLDTIGSIEELDSLSLLFYELGGSAETFSYYRENLLRWPDPQLPEGFQEECPLVTARLDTLCKIRIFLRAAHARSYYRGVTPLLMGKVFEEIIRRHEVDGEKRVVYTSYRCGAWCDVLRIVYHTELPYWTVTNLLLSDKTSSGISSTEGLRIDWRTKEEREAAGERW